MHTLNEEDLTTRRMQEDASFGAGAAAMRALLKEVRESEDPYVADLERALNDVLSVAEHEIPPRDNAHNYSPRGKTISLGWDYIDRARKLLDGDGQ